MPRVIKDIKDKNTGNLVYTRTHAKAVVVNEDQNLESFLSTKIHAVDTEDVVDDVNINYLSTSAQTLTNSELNQVKQNLDIPTKVSALENDSNYVNNEALNLKQDKIMIIDHGTNDTTFAVTPNVLHKWGTVSSLSLTLVAAPNANVANYYMIQFTSGSTATTLTMPSDIKWSSDIEIEANKTYQISILNNLGVIGGF